MNITHFNNTLNAPLTDSAPVAVPLGELHAVASTHSIERPGGVETGDVSSRAGHDL